jgi:D-glycero-alpha-D-manno-heptose-7-phosphate kinase
MSGNVKRKFSSSLLLYFTGITRSADRILSEQTKNLLSHEKFNAMEKMVALVDPFAQAMIQGDIQNCGALLGRNWELKQTLAKGISNKAIRAMYAKALNAGAIAGKITGAGGGGFLLLTVPRERQNTVFEAMRAYRELPFMLEEGGSKVIFDDRSYSSK